MGQSNMMTCPSTRLRLTANIYDSCYKHTYLTLELFKDDLKGLTKKKKKKRMNHFAFSTVNRKNNLSLQKMPNSFPILLQVLGRGTDIISL